MKILIIDDIKENLYLLETLLKGSGFEVVSAKDGIEALDKLKEESIDLIISDILMPKMDGFQLCRECKKDHSLKKIPFIFYTATYTDKKDEEFALSLGAEKFIVKPQAPQVFLKILKEVVEEHKKGVLTASQKPGKKEEVYLAEYNKRLVQKLEKKVLDLEKANKDLQEKEEKIYNLSQFQENVIHNANVWINVLDEKANVVIWNEAAEKMSGYSSKEVVGHDKIWEWLYPDEKYRKRITAKANGIIKKEEEVEDYETRICCKDDKIKIISWNSSNLTDLQGKIIGSVALGRDITQRKQAEEKLSETKEYLENLIKYSNAPIMVWDPSRSITLFNQAFEHLSGYDASEVMGKKVDILFPKNKMKNSLEQIQKTAIRERWEAVEIEIQRKDGQPRIVLWNSAYILNTEKNNVIATIVQGHDITERKQAEERLKKTMNATIETMSRIVEAKDPYTAGHQQRVFQLTTAIAKELNLSQDEIEGIRIASLIHDIGKIGLPTQILSKPNKLSDLEFSLIKEHSQAGYDILKSIDFAYPVAQIVLQHHERINGSGYPHKLNGDKILLEAKIIGVADVVEAIASDRPYRPALGIDAALEEISQNKGILYDPEVVDTCLILFKEKGFKFE